MAILTYHHIGRCPFDQREHHGLWVSEDLFREQVRWLHRHGWHSVTLNQVGEALHRRLRLPRKWVALTFDDGWRDNYTKALPILSEFGFTATVFMVSSRIRHSTAAGCWNDYLSISELQELVSKGIHIGSHTHTHPRLTPLQPDQIRRELSQSRQEIAAASGVTPTWFCYPFGNVSPAVAELVREAGYEGAVSTIRSNRVTRHQLYWAPRVMVMDDTSPARLRYMLSSLYNLVHAPKNYARWKSLK